MIEYSLVLPQSEENAPTKALSISKEVLDGPSNIVLRVVVMGWRAIENLSITNLNILVSG